MKKKIVIGLACLTAGIGLAGCAGSNQQTTESTTTVEVATEEGIFYVDGEKFTGVYYQTDELFTDFADWMPGIVYVDGIKYTGSFEDFPEDFTFIVCDNEATKETSFKKSDFDYEIAPSGFKEGVPFWGKQ